ncbi:hypothetical protein QQP08_006557, partial [Theobroma cacao]
MLRDRRTMVTTPITKAMIPPKMLVLIASVTLLSSFTGLWHGMILRKLTSGTGDNGGFSACHSAVSIAGSASKECLLFMSRTSKKRILPWTLVRSHAAAFVSTITGTAQKLWQLTVEKKK